MYAVVAVNATIHGSGSHLTGGGDPYPGPVFHYHVPDELEGQVAPGCLVEVPFGARPAQAVVIRLSDECPVPKTRPVTHVLFDEPVVSGAQIELGCWLSQTYFAPLIDCLRTMLPPGILTRARTVLRLHPEASIPEDLTQTQRAIVTLLRQAGALSPAQLARRLRRRSVDRPAQALLRKGILIRTSELPAPRARARRVQFARLSASPPQIALARPQLGRPSRQADVLHVLLHSDDPLPSVERVIERANVSRSTLSTMARKGWLEIEPERTLIVPSRGADAADLGSAHRQQAVLAYLVAHAPVERSALQQATGASASVIRALEQRGLVRRLVQPSTVQLRLEADQAKQTIRQLRGASRQHRVLDYLLDQPAGKWVSVSWIYAETQSTTRDLQSLESLGLIQLAEREVWRDPLSDTSFVLETPPMLTPDQERAWRAIAPYLGPEPPAAPAPGPSCPLFAGLQRAPRATFLLHGVTGSGKTEIYMRAVAAVRAQGRRAIVLVPEISLTPQAIRRFAARFPDGLGVIHSALSEGERYDTWRRIRQGEIQLVVGPRSALFAPLEDVGLIVLDEEHSDSFKESDRMPAYHARHVAAYIAASHDAVLILGSATPDLSSYFCARETDAVHLIELPQRILKHRLQIESQSSGPATAQPRYRPLGSRYGDVYVTDLPPVRVVDMRHELRMGNRSIFSRALSEAMRRALSQGEQVILFLNRRGTSTFVMCRDCGTVILCPRCNIPLVYHSHGARLTCHHCNHQQPAPRVCPVCQSRRIRHFGVGTQRVEEAVSKAFPDARVLRWDRDTTRERGSHAAILDLFTRHQADVLIGTQMIAKGLDLPLVTVVGVISADTALRLPDYRAAERTFQLLAQVAGRAGRGARGGAAIVQTYAPDHYAIRAASQHDYAAFYEHERAFRLETDYPPFSTLVRLIYTDPDQARCHRAVADLERWLRTEIRQQRIEDVSIIGPAPCFFARLRGRWRWHILLRAPRGSRALRRLLGATPLPAGWRIDVEPTDVL